MTYWQGVFISLMLIYIGYQLTGRKYTLTDLKKAYEKGYNDALQKRAESEDK